THVLPSPHCQTSLQRRLEVHDPDLCSSNRTPDQAFHLRTSGVDSLDQGPLPPRFRRPPTASRLTPPVLSSLPRRRHGCPVRLSDINHPTAPIVTSRRCPTFRAAGPAPRAALLASPKNMGVFSR